MTSSKFSVVARSRFGFHFTNRFISGMMED